jgi:integrase
MATIEQRKTGDGQTRYRVLVRLKGHPAQSATFERKTDAKRWALHTEAAIREGRHFKTTEAKRHTLAELIERYKRDVLPNKPKSEATRSQQLEWWSDQLGEKLLADVTPALIAEYRDRLASTDPETKAKRSNATINRYLAALSHAFTIAVREWGWVEANPLQKVTKPKEPRGRVRFLTDDETRPDGKVIEGERTRLLKACKQSASPYLYQVVVLAISTGMRRGEILNLAWDDVDLTRGRATLHDTKNGERRVVPLVGLALEMLKEHAKVRRIDNSLLFVGRNDKPVDIGRAWDTALEKAGIENFRFHDLRHTAASYLAMNGASVAEIAEVLGHKTLQMVKRYAHLSESHTAKVVERMNEKIFG